MRPSVFDEIVAVLENTRFFITKEALLRKTGRLKTSGTFDKAMQDLSVQDKLITTKVIHKWPGRPVTCYKLRKVDE